MIQDREWEDADYRDRPVPVGRFVMSPTGTTRRVVAHDLSGVTYEEVVRAGRGGTLRDEPMPRYTRLDTPTVRLIREQSWRSFTREAVLLPATWSPAEPLPANRFRLAAIEQRRAEEARRADEAAARTQREREVRETRRALESHLRQEWEDGEFLLISAQDSVIDQRHLNHYNGHPRAKNWLARVWCERTAPGSLGREFLARVPGNWTCCRVDRLRVGDYIEAGADDITHNGDRRANRLYFRILAQVGELFLVRRRETPPAVRLSEPTLAEEIADLTRWLETKDVTLAARFTAFVER